MTREERLFAALVWALRDGALVSYRMGHDRKLLVGACGCCGDVLRPENYPADFADVLTEALTEAAR